MTTVSPMNALVDQLTEMNEYFMDVAAGDGLAPLLLLVGTLLVFVSMAVFGVLTLGAVVDLVTPE